jgi:hypothetical protein
MEGGNRNLFEGTISGFSGGTEENCVHFQSR